MVFLKKNVLIFNNIFNVEYAQREMINKTFFELWIFTDIHFFIRQKIYFSDI